jgi:hypothetical protein
MHNRSLALWLLAALVLIPVGDLLAQPYQAVTDEDMPRLKFNHYFTPEKKNHAGDFEWSFTKTDFVMKKGKGAIPEHLQKALLPEGTSADDIRGKWKIEEKNGRWLVLTDIKSGDKAGKESARVTVHPTPSSCGVARFWRWASMA